jgi:hypothetical protein
MTPRKSLLAAEGVAPASAEPVTEPVAEAVLEAVVEEVEAVVGAAPPRPAQL